jgi:hypothetical protein
MSADPKLIFEPESTQQLLHGWLLHAHKGRERHDLAARRCDLTRRWLGGAATALAAVVGTSIFAAWEKDLGGSNRFFQFGIVTIAIASAVLTALSSFLNLAERTEKHRAAGVHYKKMIRELERILSQPVDDLRPDHPEVTRLQEQLNELEENAPVVPEKLYQRIEDEWKQKGVKPVPIAEELYHRKQSQPSHS